MKTKEIIETIEKLSNGQGFYGRLLDSITSMSDYDYDMAMQYLEEQDFKDTLDLIMFFEN